jgi:hypothetical protein
MAPKKDWSIYTVDILKVECGKRSLVRSGTKADLISRLETCEIQESSPNRSNKAPLSQAPKAPALASSVHNGVAINSLDEKELERICKENWTPYTSDPHGNQRREAIYVEQKVIYNEAISKRNAAIARARTKCDKILEECREKRDEKLKELQQELAPIEAKKRVWAPAFQKLKVGCWTYVNCEGGG